MRDGELGMRRGDADDYGRAAGREGGSPGPLFGAVMEGPFARSAQPPTDAERTIAWMIWEFRGWRRAVSTEGLIARLAARGITLDRRGLEAVIAELRRSHRLPIGALRGNPRGYFVMETEEDWVKGTQQYRDQLVAGWRTLRAMEPPPALLREWQGQMRLEA